jgi:hypothetical protein
MIKRPGGRCRSCPPPQFPELELRNPSVFNTLIDNPLLNAIIY